TRRPACCTAARRPARTAARWGIESRGVTWRRPPRASSLLLHALQDDDLTLPGVPLDLLRPPPTGRAEAEHHGILVDGAVDALLRGPRIGEIRPVEPRRRPGRIDVADGEVDEHAAVGPAECRHPVLEFQAIPLSGPPLRTE